MATGCDQSGVGSRESGVNLPTPDSRLLTPDYPIPQKAYTSYAIYLFPSLSSLSTFNKAII